MPPKRHVKPKASAPATVCGQEDDVAAAERLEADLVWCLNQLALGFKPKNRIDPQEIYRVLKSSSTTKVSMRSPWCIALRLAQVQQRAVMRLAFGDYRAAMEKQKAVRWKSVLDHTLTRYSQRDCP